MKLERFLESYDGSPITVKELAKTLNKSVGTIQNNKKEYTEKGIVFKHGAIGKTIKDKKLSKLTNSNSNTLKVMPKVYRSVCNFISIKLGLLPKFIVASDVYNASVSKQLTLSSAKVYLERAYEANNVKVHDKRIISSVLLELRNLTRSSLTEEEEKDITEVFLRVTGHTPDKEQVRAISMMARTLTKTRSLTYVQARAGASKTTCINVLAEYLSVYFNTKCHAVTFTRKASKELTCSKTLHKLVKDLLKLEDMNNRTEYNLKYEVEKAIYEGTLDKLPHLIVDEYGTMSNTMMDIAKMLSDNVIFVGDTAQIVQNQSFTGSCLCSLTKQYRFLGSADSSQVSISDARFANDYEAMKEVLKSKMVGVFSGKLKYRSEGTKKVPYTDYKDAFNHLSSILDAYKDRDSLVVSYSLNAVEELNVVMNGSQDIKEGSKVSITQSLYRPDVSAGTLGRVVKVHDSVATVFTEDCEMVKVELTDLKLAYAMTTLSAQGSSAKRVLYVHGTAPQEHKLSDAYVGPTRAEVDWEVISRDFVDCEINNFFSVLDMKEGNRNTSIYETSVALGGIIREADYDMSEAEPTILSGLKVKTHEPAKETVETKTNNYCCILIARDGGYIFPKAEDRNLTRGEAEELLKTSKGYLAEELKGGDRIVIDCDSRETVDAFKKYADTTEAYVSDDSMHLVFTVDKLFPRITGKKDLDLLGNKVHSLRLEKPNKTPNNKEAIPLPQEVLELLCEYHPKLKEI